MPKENIPSIDECMKLIAKYDMLPNIIKHSEQVMAVALAISDNLKENIDVNRDLITAASLLHDITKTRSLDTRERHDQTGGELLRELGYDSVARIVEEHVIIKDFNPAGKLLEKEIVFYADKRVKHTKIVSIDERVLDLVERYGKTPEIKELILKNKTLIIQIENKIKDSMTVNINQAINSIASPQN